MNSCFFNSLQRVFCNYILSCCILFHVIPHHELVSDDWKVAIKARAKSACTFCRAVATKSGEAD